MAVVCLSVCLSVCLFVCLFVRSITQKRMIPKCSNLTDRQTNRRSRTCYPRPGLLILQYCNYCNKYCNTFQYCKKYCNIQCMFSIAFGVAILLEVKYCNTQNQYFLSNILYYYNVADCCLPVVHKHNNDANVMNISPFLTYLLTYVRFLCNSSNILQVLYNILYMVSFIMRQLTT